MTFTTISNIKKKKKKHWPHDGASASWPNYLPKTSSPNIMISGVRALAHEFPGAVIVSVGVGEVCQGAHLQDLPARNSQGRVFLAASPGCLPSAPGSSTPLNPRINILLRNKAVWSQLGFGLPHAHLRSCGTLGLLSPRVTQLLHQMPWGLGFSTCGSEESF